MSREASFGRTAPSSATALRATSAIQIPNATRGVAVVEQRVAGDADEGRGEEDRAGERWTERGRPLAVSGRMSGTAGDGVIVKRCRHGKYFTKQSKNAQVIGTS